MQNVTIIELGLKDYKETWDFQTTLFEGIISNKQHNKKNAEQKPIEHRFILCQHPHVYTLGKSGDEQNLLVSKAMLQKKKPRFTT